MRRPRGSGQDGGWSVSWAEIQNVSRPGQTSPRVSPQGGAVRGALRPGTLGRSGDGGASLEASPPARFGDSDCRVIWGEVPDALDSHVPDGSVDLIFADPPYNIGKRFGDADDKWPSPEAYATWCYQWLEVCLRKLSPTGTLYVMTSTQAMPFLDIFLRDRLTILSRIVWSYDSSGVQAKNFFGSLYEPMLHAVVNPKAYTFNAQDILVEARTGAQRKLIDYRGAEPKEYATTKIPGNVWTFPRVRYRMPEYEEHPTQKPEALLERVILASSNEGDLVLDPFAGTFTTCAVAKRLGRRTVGIERVEDYVGIGLRRLGIAQTLNGVDLRPVAKNTKRRDRKNASVETQMQLGGLGE